MRISSDGRTSRIRSDSRGFTLVETMVTLVVMAVVVVVLMAIMYAVSRNKTAQMNRVESSQGARVVAEKLSSDLRAAGYGTDDSTGTIPQPPIAYIDSVQVLINANLLPYPDTSATLGHQAPLAYDPSGSPKPFPLSGTVWAPPVKYHTGAEVIRWTLDTNNDGVIDASDIAGTDAANTPNPNDYLLVRQVYGDSSGNVAGNNGGSNQGVAFVRKPGAGIPALFTVYMKGVAAPWSWSNGPIPPARLGEIERVVVNITSSSPRPDSKGNYSETSYRTEIASMRNIPNTGVSEYSVDGYVYDDKNFNHVYDAGDVAVPNATVRLGSVVAITNSLGYYMASAIPGTYTLRQTVPTGYGIFMASDSTVVTIGPSSSYSFADTSAHGGWVNVSVFDDANADGIPDGTNLYHKGGIVMTMTPGAAQTTTPTGTLNLFVYTGNYSLSVTPPDSFVVTTTNPMAGTMTDGGTATYAVGIKRVPVALVNGKVFIDTNKNGTLDAGETGMAGAWVGCSTDAGITIQDYAATDASGNYALTVPANSPPGTTPYSIICIPISGYYATGTTAINGLYLTGGQVLNNQNFGLAAFQVISLASSRVLSLGAGDLVEKDWAGATTSNAHKDTDIILGADANGADQISVWFNAYNASPLFASARDYSRAAPNSVLSLALDSLVVSVPSGRTDLVTGCKSAASGNFFVWFCQGTSSNEGFYPNSYSQAYRTNDNGDVQAVLTGDFAGGAGHDILVGTNAGAYTGTLEVWQSNDAATPTFTRSEIYPPAGPLAGAYIGEVTSMEFADLDNDGDKDLIVGTKTSSNNGNVMIFRYNSKITGNRFVYVRTLACSDWVMGVTALDVDGDGWIDIVAGTQHNNNGGNLLLWKNDGSAVNLTFTNTRTISVGGIPVVLKSGDVLGVSRKDVIVGWRQTSASYVGGVRIYPTDTGTLPATGYDPSGGTVVNMVPAITLANFNYGIKPSQPAAPFLLDIAVGVKITDTTGALVVMIR